jgi:hypothetical protein
MCNAYQAKKRSAMLERDLKISMQETQAQSTALNKLTTHVLHMQVVIHENW